MVRRRCSCEGLLPPLAAEILEDWVPLRCSAAGFGIGEEPQARCVQGRKTKRPKLSPVTARTGVRGPGGYTGTPGPYSASARARAGRSVQHHVCSAIGAGPQRAGANSDKHAPLISAWSAIVHSDIGHGFGGQSVLCRSPPSWTIPLRISGFPQQHADWPTDYCYSHAPCREWYRR